MNENKTGNKNKKSRAMREETLGSVSLNTSWTRKVNQARIIAMYHFTAAA
jgi:hypothetical protein